MPLSLPRSATPGPSPATPRRPAPTSLVLSLAALAMMGFTLSGCGEAGSAPSAGTTGAPVGATAAATSVGVYTVSAESLTLSTELPGRTTAPTVAEIRPQVSGIIQARQFTEGGPVKTGQALYQIDAATYQASFDSAKAAVAKAEATASSARLTAKRQAELLKIQAVSEQDQQDAQSTLQQAEADLASAKAALDTARINLQRTIVTSPISGLADVSSVTTGALVTAEQTTALTTVRQIDPIQVDISQSSSEWLALRRELAAGRFKQADNDTAAVQLLLEDGSTYARAGKLSVRGVSVNTSTGAVTLRAVVPNPEGLLLPGMYVRALLQTVRLDQALLVPQQAVTRDTHNTTTVLTVDATQQVHKRTVQLDRVVGNRWLVSSGLQAGEQVIVEGGQKVRDGDKVQAHRVSLPADRGAAVDTATASTPAAAASATAGSTAAATATATAASLGVVARGASAAR
ncbi:efflux RND transporter periplasmic adaptor subunit [Roseateles sp. SL47]|uniref:efflux RND transporter periplasmic adaptor subunit n=1 Tax=Roseateles sp. SL47 TaxID=2995138 RepID=UPI00226DC594|nr:efflux RND transporter periplasmic adaptor subunit [Roseateles sp. SL47]WAC73236.1 efflux RND transporter periplasmic adaptor subunit [Roseateles sp. SL47]